MCSFTFFGDVSRFSSGNSAYSFFLMTCHIVKKYCMANNHQKGTAPAVPVISRKLHPAPAVLPQNLFPQLPRFIKANDVPISVVFPRLLQYYCRPHPHAALYFRPLYQAMIRLIHQRHSFVHILAIVCYMDVPWYHPPHKQSQFFCSFY